jgi:hypothetical protein
MARKIEMQVGESREHYVTKARNWCRNRFQWLRDNDFDYQYCHESHAVSRAMRDTEEVYVDLGTFGDEGDCAMNGEGCFDIQYLNTGETYELTVVYYKGRFLVTSWGNIAESQMS